MKYALLAATLLATPALAAKPSCVSIDKARAGIEKQSDEIASHNQTKFGAPMWTRATPAQFVWATGVYVGNPGEPADVMPTGDGALILHRKGMPVIAVLWTTGGKLSCGGFITLNPKKAALLDSLRTLKALSELDGGGDSSDSL